MNNFTLVLKKALEVIVEGGAQVVSVGYDPTLSINPELGALAQGFIEFYREDTPTLIEVIYTK